MSPSYHLQAPWNTTRRRGPRRTSNRYPCRLNVTDSSSTQPVLPFAENRAGPRGMSDGTVKAIDQVPSDSAGFVLLDVS